jgi:hypothetical protein
MNVTRAKPAFDALHTVSASPVMKSAALAPYNSSVVIPLALMAHV